MVATALASPVCVSASTLDDADPVPPRHGVVHALVIIRLAAPVSVGAPGSPSSSLPPEAALVGLVEQTPLAISDDELCSPSDLDDDRLSSEVLLHIAYEVVSQLDRAEDFWLLSPDKQDLCDFLEDHITSLQLVVEVASLQDTAAPSVVPDSLVLVQDSSPTQLGASSAMLRCQHSVLSVCALLAYSVLYTSMLVDVSPAL
jgi:hypothetical protein